MKHVIPSKQSICKFISHSKIINPYTIRMCMCLMSENLLLGIKEDQNPPGHHSWSHTCASPPEMCACLSLVFLNDVLHVCAV